MALVPLVAGIYWRRANNTGAIASIVLGLLVWLPMEFIAPDGALPPHFIGFFAAIIGMLGGTLLSRKQAPKI